MNREFEHGYLGPTVRLQRETAQIELQFDADSIYGAKEALSNIIIIFMPPSRYPLLRITNELQPAR